MKIKKLPSMKFSECDDFCLTSALNQEIDDLVDSGKVRVQLI